MDLVGILETAQVFYEGLFNFVNRDDECVKTMLDGVTACSNSADAAFCEDEIVLNERLLTG